MACRVGVTVAVGLGVNVPLGVELAVGEGPGVCVAVGGDVLLGVGVMLGVGVRLGVGEGPGVLVEVLVGTGVLVDVGTGVLVTRTLNEPLFTLDGIAVAAGFDAITLLMVSDETPALVTGKTLKCTWAIAPSNITFALSPATIRLQLPVQGVRVGDQLTDFPAAEAADPVSICETDSSEPSKLKVKLTPETWAPPSEDRLIGMTTVSPGLPESLPIDITASADWAAAPPAKARIMTQEIKPADICFFMS